MKTKEEIEKVLIVFEQKKNSSKSEKKRLEKTRTFNMMKYIIDTDRTNKLHKPIIDAEEQQKEQTQIIIVE